MIKKIKVLIMFLVLGVFSTLCVYAKEPAEGIEKTSLSLNYENGKGVFTIYKVAEFSETGQFNLEEPFSSYQIVLEGLDSEGWRALAETLEGYVKRDSIKPMDKKETDENGKVEWENLEKGLYLVLGEQSKDEQYLYTPMPTLITLPNRMQNGEWENHVSIDLKYNREDISQEQEIDFNVIKVWKDEESKTKRPKNIIVQLLKDGNVFDTVELNRENNWKYRWERLPLQASWSVVEQEVPSNYTVTSRREGNTFILTNTKMSSEPTSGNQEAMHHKLPQTGQLWWPVPILAILGIILFTIGFKNIKK